MPPRLIVYFGLLYVVFCWALNTVLLKSVVATIDPLALTFMRFLIMTPLAFGLVRIARERLTIERRDLPLLIACGACGYGVYQYFWIIGLSHTTAFASSLLGSTTPIFTLAILALAGYERVRSGRWLGAAIAILGVAIFEGAFAGHAAFRIGDILTMCASLIFATYSVLSSRLLDRYSPLGLLAITMAIGTIMIAPGGIPALLHTDLRIYGWAMWGPFIFATLFPILLTYPVWSYGITNIGAARVSLFAFLMPVIAGILSVPILHAHFELYQLVGAAICLGGMLLANAIGRVSLRGVFGLQAVPSE